ncbi:omega-hydroxypalmitate O-feruloyl transferase-like [Sesamum indicum]|uniref:Omega-hydroxypalmitate O-feruloyl transferase-like n=1 Tax=Sesamum indicum TaxID=4182 RepID=A0A6I9UZ23_SESIN|nr:omega-hydroxypalmitate O-feruloyl transferase-like [Sesamum indicum]
MAFVLPVPPMQDLKLKLQQSTLVSPAKQTENQAFFLSNIDQFLNYDILTVHFFKANPDFPPETVAKRLKMALERVLVPYDFLAGRLKLNLHSGRLEIDCNSAGVGFVVASSECSLDELGDLVCPNLGFRQLSVQTLDNLGPEVDQLLCVFKVTSFKCGGFSIGMSTNHVLFDGVSAQIFIENLATQAFDDKPLAIIPCNDRHLLAARAPPHVEFPHPEFFKPDLPAGLGPPVFDCEREELDYTVFSLTLNAVNYLKDKARESISSTSTKITSFIVVAALIWRCKALSNYTEYNKDRVSTLFNIVDLRSRLNPSLPNSYCGNAVLGAYSSATCDDIKKWPFSKLVELVAEEPKRMTDEYAKSTIDWLEINKGLPRGEYTVSSWLRMRFGEVVYPWGKPMHSGPVVSYRKDICWIFPGVDRVNALVSLPAKEMERFVACCREFFPQSIIN